MWRLYVQDGYARVSERGRPDLLDPLAGASVLASDGQVWASAAERHVALPLVTEAVIHVLR
jgi:hypothetical protein